MTDLHKTKQRGVSLLELLIVVTIVALITAFAYPSYENYVVNTKRSAATTTMLQIADRQQQFFMDNKQYAADLTNLGFAADPLIISDDGNPVAAGDASSVYSFDLSNLAATTYTVTATPLNAQGKRDTKCGNLTLTQAGVKGNSGTGDDCW